MDLSLYPNAIAMNKEEFMEWSNNALDEIIRASGTKRMMDKMTAPMWSWAQRNSLHPLHFGIACCALEMAAASACRYDAERLGVIYRSTPRQSDVLLVNGWITNNLRPDLRRLYEQMAEPKWVVAMGECAISGGPWYDSYNTIQGLDTFIPVDVYIPGCPPRPEAMIDGFLKLQQKIRIQQQGTLLIK